MNTANLTERQRILIETAQARDKAETLLHGLIEARASSETRLAQLNQRDIMKKVTGSSSIDNAIDSTRRMIESLNRTLESFRREIADEDLGLIEERAGS